MKKILILAANPRGTTPLRLDEEVREIDAGLQRAKQREQFVLEQKWAVRPRDIQRAMLDINPQIVHFSGHGVGDEGLVFEDEVGQAKLVDGEALAGLFELFADQVECVVLNGCYSEIQVEAITEHINYVIGMKKAIGDKAAIEFAVGFYDALGSGRPIEFAYKFGCAAIRLAGISEQMTPILKKKPNANEAVVKISVSKEQPPTKEEAVSVSPTIPIEVFFSYAHEDEELKNELVKHLSILKRQGVITAWHDREITAGTEWAGEIDRHLNTAHIILLLISSDFLASDYCYDIELAQAMERHATGEACVIPVILREVDWKGAVFGKLQALPKNADPVANWVNRDQAFADVARGIRKAVEELKQQPSPQAISQLSFSSIEIEQELNDSDREILTELLIRSGRAEYSARKALCIKIGIEANQLGFFRQSTDADFALELISYLHSIGNKQALCKICSELEVVFKEGKYCADLENTKSKLNCKNVRG
jgi:TIR domain/CHAT domain